MRYGIFDTTGLRLTNFKFHSVDSAERYGRHIAHWERFNIFARADAQSRPTMVRQIAPDYSANTEHGSITTVQNAARPSAVLLHDRRPRRAMTEFLAMGQ